VNHRQHRRPGFLEEQRLRRAIRAASIEGTLGSDVIYADDPAKAPQGTSLRVLNVVAEVPAKGLDLLEVLIPSLPPGYAIANATLTDKGWLVKIDQGKIEKLTDDHRRDRQDRPGSPRASCTSPSNWS